MPMRIRRTSSLKEYTSTSYSVMWYKRDKAVGIREKNTPAKKQVFSFGRTPKTTEEAGRQIADQVLRKLDQGMRIADAKTWADSQIDKLNDDVD